MATSTNSEKQCRAVLLLTRAGTEMLRGIVVDCVSQSGSSIDGFLQINYYKISHIPSGKKRDIRWVEDVLFPMNGGTDINKWELNVLCFIVLDVCVVHPHIINNVEDLKEMRNKLYHAAEMSDEEYDKCAEKIEKMVLTCCRTLSNATLTSKVEALIQSIKEDPLSLGQCVRILRTWYEREQQISDRLVCLSTDHIEINDKLDFLIKTLCPNMKPSGLQFEIQIKDSQRTKEVAGILVKMINAYRQQQMACESTISPSVDNRQDEKDKSSEATGGNTVGTQGSQQASVAVQQICTTESSEPSMENVKQELELVLCEFCKDQTVIINCYEKSVHMIFQCSSFCNLLIKLSECLEGKTTRLFLPAQTALRQLEGCEQICLDVIVMKSWYWKCIENTVELLEKRLQGALQTVDKTETTLSEKKGEEAHYASLYLSVASTSVSALIDLKNKCSSDEMKEKVARLTEALKDHFGIENLSLEIKVHQLPLPVSDDDSDSGISSDASQTIITEAIDKLEMERPRPLREMKLMKGAMHSVSAPRYSMDTSKVKFHWKMLSAIGCGAFGDVYRVLDLDTGELMAMKKVKLLETSPPYHLKESVDVIELLKRITHPNVVKHYGVEIHKAEMLVFMEYCNGGTLDQASSIGLTEDLIQIYTKQLLEAVQFLHANKIVHRNIKGTNIFLTSDDCLKLGGLGLAVKLDYNTMSKTPNQVVGTVSYMAPEVITMQEGQMPGLSADIWSLGCVVIEMASGEEAIERLPMMSDIARVAASIIGGRGYLASGLSPWHELDSMFQIMFKVSKGEKPQIPDKLGKEGKDFVTRCHEADPKQRWTASELLDHPFVKRQGQIGKTTLSVDFQEQDGHSVVLSIVTKCLMEVEKRGINLKGIYRVIGARNKVQNLCQRFETDPQSINLDNESIHVISNALRLYLRHLPEPLLTLKLYPGFIQMAKENLSGSLNKYAALEKLGHLINSLPFSNRKTCGVLMCHLQRIAAFSDQNQMDATKLGIVFGPVLVSPQGGLSMAYLEDTHHQAQVVELLIIHAKTLFGPQEGNQRVPGETPVEPLENKAPTLVVPSQPAKDTPPMPQLQTLQGAPAREPSPQTPPDSNTGMEF